MNPNRPAALALLFAAVSVQAQIGLPIGVPVPPNDLFANATLVTGDVLDLQADLASAGPEAFEVFHTGQFGHTVWWRWTAPDTGVKEWKLDGGAEHVSLAVFAADPLGQLTRISFDIGQGVFPAHAGSTYWLQADAAFIPPPGILVFMPAPNSFTPYPIHIVVQSASASPANDDFSAREALIGTHAVFGGSVRTATSELGEPRLPGDSLQRTRWWTWTAPVAGTARIRSTGAGMPPGVGIYQIGGLFQLEKVADSVTEFGNRCYVLWAGRETVEWDTVPGHAYEIQVDRYPNADPDADAQLELEFTPAPANDDFANPQVLTGTDLALTVDNFGATRNASDPILPYQTGAGSVWFQWQAPARGILQVTTNEPVRFGEPSFEVLPPGGSWTYGSVFTIDIGMNPCSGPFADLHPLPPFQPVFGLYLAGNSGGTPIYNLAAYETNTVVAEVYGDTRIQFDGNAGVSGSTRMNLLYTAPPANDRFADRIALPSAPVNVGGRTFAATPEVGDPVGARTVWWEWKAPAAGLWVLRPRTGSGSHQFILIPGTGQLALSDSKSTEGAPLIFPAGTGDMFQVCVAAKDGFGDNIGFSLEAAILPPLTPAPGMANRPDSQPFALTWPAQFDLPLVVETSINLTDWQALAPGATVGSGSASEPVTAGDPMRFYRMRLIPQ